VNDSQARARLPPPIVALSPGDVRAEHATRLLDSARAAFAAGLRGVVLRESGMNDRDFLALACELRAVLPRDSGGWLCLHDRPHLAAEVGADAVHLGFRSLKPRELRPWLAPDIALGLSTHAEDDEREWGSADYLFHGPVFATPHKPHARAPIGFDGLLRSTARTAVPLWALGGMQPEHAADALAARAHGMAVLSGILVAQQPGARAARYVAAWAAATMRP
jgi:thiamine-phosphate pyrophosphorylase